MVGILVSFWGPAHFQVRTVSFREGNGFKPPFWNVERAPNPSTTKKTHLDTMEGLPAAEIGEPNGGPCGLTIAAARGRF